MQKKKIKIRKETLIIISILLLASILRFWGINFGLPYTYHGDEQTQINLALKIIATGDFNPHWFYYPSLFIYLLTFLYYPLNLIKQNNLVINNPSIYYYLGRSLAALIGIVNIYILYRVSKKIFGNKIALISALLLSVNFTHVVHSHYVKMDVLLTLFGLFVLYFAYKVYKEGGYKSYLLTGLFIGLANSTKYCPSLLIYLIAAHLLRCFESKKIEIINWKIICAVLAGIFGFFIGTPYLFLSFKEVNIIKDFFVNVFFSRSEQAVIISSDNGISSFSFYLSYLTKLGMSNLLFISSLIGVCLVIKNKGIKFTILFLSFPVVYLVILSFSRIRVERYLLPIIPSFVILSAVFINSLDQYLTSRFKEKTLLFINPILAMAFLFFPLSKSIYFDFRIADTGKDTQTVAYNWINNYLNEEPVYLIGIFQYAGGKLFKLDKSFVREWSPALNKEINYYTAKGFKYIIDGNYNLVNNYKNTNYYQKQYENYVYLLKNNLLVKEIYDNKFETSLNIKNGEGSSGISLHSPHIRIFKLPEFTPESAIDFKYEDTIFSCSKWVLIKDKETLDGSALFLNATSSGSFCNTYDSYGKGSYEAEIRIRGNKNSNNLYFEFVKGGTTSVIKRIPLLASSLKYQTIKIPYELNETSQGQLSFQFLTEPKFSGPIYFDYLIIRRKR